MRIKSIHLENFKCFEKIDIDLSKLTILTGANSSGKSSIIYSILGAMQSDNFPFDYSLNGKFVRMGDYNDVIFNHNIDLNIKLGYKIEHNKGMYEIETSWKNDKKNNLPILQKLNISNGNYTLNLEKKRKYNLEFTINEIDENLKKMEITTEFFPQLLKAIGDDDEKINQKSFNEFFETFVASTKPVKFSMDNLNEIIRLNYVHGNLSLSNVIKNARGISSVYENKTNFISSFRLYPEQTYYEESQKNLKVGRFGEKYQDQLIDWENKNSEEIQNILAEMQALDLIDEIKLKRFGGGRFEVLVKVKKSSIYAALSDVGFGVSQFLPIIVADAQLGNSSNLIVAQPEIHLHPSVQAKFGNYLANQIKNNDKNYIIETHSEYLLNRVRLLIVKGELLEEDVSVYYLENDGDVSKSHKIEFKKDGQILNAPQSFFDTYMIDVMDIALSA